MMEPVTLITGKSDKDIAEELKKKLIEGMVPVLALMDDANKAGFRVEWQIVMSPVGKNVIASVSLLKIY